MRQYIQEWTKENLWKAAFKKFEVIWSALVCLGKPYHFTFFKGCLPQIILSPFLNTLCHVFPKTENICFSSKHLILLTYFYVSFRLLINFDLVYTLLHFSLNTRTSFPEKKEISVKCFYINSQSILEETLRYSAQLSAERSLEFLTLEASNIGFS